MDKTTKNIKRILFFVFILFALLIGAYLKFLFLDSGNIVSNPHNPRLYRDEEGIIPGNIYDINGNVLAKVEGDAKNFKRYYPYGEIAAHVVGFTNAGKSGVEAKYNFELQNIRFELIKRIQNLFNEETLTGNSIVLTLDMDIQELAYKKLGKRKGAIVVMEPSTGKIIAQVSYPTFNPNTIEKDWDNYKSEDNGALLNRASQGLYPPGSVFKAVTAGSMIKSMINYNSLTYECSGEETFGEKIIHCYDSKKHGKVNIYEAMAYSCNTFFAKKAYSLGKESLYKMANNLFFNQELNYPLAYSKSSFTLKNSSSESEIVETLIGQGKTLVSPLHMAMIYSCIANDGMMMKPYIYDHSLYTNGDIGNKNMPEKMAIVFTPKEAKELSNMLLEVVEYGTGTSAQIEGVKVAGKTGTAETGSGEPHSWFVGYAPADKPEVVVVVLIENAGNGSNSAPIARDIIKEVLKKNLDKK